MKTLLDLGHGIVQLPLSNCKSAVFSEHIHTLSTVLWLGKVNVMYEHLIEYPAIYMNTLDRSRHFGSGTFLNRGHYYDIWCPIEHPAKLIWIQGMENEILFQVTPFYLMYVGACPTINLRNPVLLCTASLAIAAWLTRQHNHSAQSSWN